MLIKPRIFSDKKDAPANAKIVDAFSVALRELFFIDNPQFKKEMPAVELEIQKYIQVNKIPDLWIYYSEINTLVRCLPEEEYFKLRTARNRDLISKEEQINYRNTIVGVAGLSVGSSVISALVMSGGPKVMKISDFDCVEVSNLNRIRARLYDINLNKTEVAAREVWSLDPFAEIDLYPEGINNQNIEKFISGDPKINIFVDAMDSIELKIRARLICKKNGVPVVMATDNGDSVILDVERFDLEPEREIFHGLLGKTEDINTEVADYKTWLNFAARIIGPEYLTEAMQESVLKIGKSLANVPQLGPTALISGSACTFAIRRIANHMPLNSGRFILSLEEKLIPGFYDLSAVESRKKLTSEFIKAFSNKNAK
jgi:hypothetical protein